jgi:hypothetical protein
MGAATLDTQPKTLKAARNFIERRDERIRTLEYQLKRAQAAQDDAESSQREVEARFDAVSEKADVLDIHEAITAALNDYNLWGCVDSLRTALKLAGIDFPRV